MQTLPEHFDELLHRIQPVEERIERVKEVPAEVRDYLKDSDKIRTVAPHTRLAGSYARNTAICDIKDVDIILLVDPKYKEGKAEEVLDDLTDALKGLPEALDDSGEVTQLRRQRRSVHAHFDKRDFDVDVVPAVAPDGLRKSLYVPDKDWSKWVESHPLGYGEHLSDLNGEYGGKVVPLSKMLKLWRDVRMKYRRPKSYWLECLVVRHIEKGWVVTEGKSYAESFTAILGSIYDRFLPKFEKDGAVPSIADPMLGNNVAWNWKRAEFETFMHRVDESYRWAVRALEKEDGDQEEAIGLWQRVFNDEGQEYFPTSVDDEASRVAAAARAGKALFITSTGKVLDRRPADSQAWPSPPHRFYG